MELKKQKKNLYLAKFLEEQEYEELMRAIGTGHSIITTLIRILEYRQGEVGRRDDLLDDPNYAIKRAYLDGRDKELAWFLQQLMTKEAQTNERSIRTEPRS